jgi:hypothetical protein
MMFDAAPSIGRLQTACRKRLPIASEYVRWLSAYRWHVALTLNFRADVRRQDAVRAARVYWQRIDVELFGSNAVQRRGMRLGRACFIEGEAGVRNWHYHAAVQLPAMEDCRWDAAMVSSPARFGDALMHRWSSMREAGRFSRSEQIYGEQGWLDYISKDVGKGDCELCTATSHITRDSDTM